MAYVPKIRTTSHQSPAEILWVKARLSSLVWYHGNSESPSRLNSEGPWKSLTKHNKYVWAHQRGRCRDTNKCKYSCLNNRTQGKGQRRDPQVQKWSPKTRQGNSSLHWSKLISFSASAYKHLSLTLSLQALTSLGTSEWLSKHQTLLDDVFSLLGTSGH